MMFPIPCVLVAVVGLSGVPVPVEADEPAAPQRTITLTIRAGQHDRRGSLLKFPLPPGRLDPALARAVLDQPFGLPVTDPTGPPDAPPTVAEARRLPDGSFEVAWFLPRLIPAGGEARFEIDGGAIIRDGPVPWSSTATPGGEVTVRHQPDRPVFRYNAGPTVPPPSQSDPRLIRDAYIHPAYTPGGALVTGDFSSFHPHHRGFFLAYVHTRWGDLEPDFWNIQAGSGRIVADGFDPPSAGPVSWRFEARHRWEAIRPGRDGKPEYHVALRERWGIELYDVPGSPYWLFDLTSTQQAEGHPLEVVPHRYGGMAYRSAEPSVVGPLDVLTAEGRHRFDGDQKPTRWVDLTGPVADGSPNYAGAMIADHPSNIRFPTVARIHPITLPFFSFVPAHDETLRIAIEAPLAFRYRVLIHDGRPDPALNDRIARDFTDPASVRLD